MPYKGYFNYAHQVISLYYYIKSNNYTNYIKMSQIKVNGKEQAVNFPLSLSELLVLNNVAEPTMVSIQVNGSFVVREEYDTTKLTENDEVDFLYFMGGGSN